MKHYGDILLVLGALVFGIVLVSQQVRIEALEADLETLRGGSGMSNAALVQRLNILENAFDLRLGYLEAGKVIPRPRGLGKVRPGVR